MGDQVVNYCEQLGFPLLHISGCFYFANLSPLFSSGPTTSCPIPLSFWTFSTVETFPFWPKTVCAHTEKTTPKVFLTEGQGRKRIMYWNLVCGHFCWRLVKMWVVLFVHGLDLMLLTCWSNDVPCMIAAGAALGGSILYLRFDHDGSSKLQSMAITVTTLEVSNDSRAWCFSIFFHAILPRRFWVWEHEPAPLRVVFSHAIIAVGSLQYTHCWYFNTFLDRTRLSDRILIPMNCSLSLTAIYSEQYTEKVWQQLKSWLANPHGHKILNIPISIPRMLDILSFCWQKITSFVGGFRTFGC